MNREDPLFGKNDTEFLFIHPSNRLMQLNIVLYRYVYFQIFLITFARIVLYILYEYCTFLFDMKTLTALQYI